MTIDDYFSNLERGLSRNVKIGSPEQPIICLASDDYNGLVRCRLFFWDDICENWHLPTRTPYVIIFSES